MINFLIKHYLLIIWTMVVLYWVIGIHYILTINDD